MVSPGLPLAACCCLEETGVKPSIIFDVDGTLVDSNDAHAQAWVDVLEEHETPVPFERVRPLIGMGGDKVLPLLTGIEHESEEGERISSRRSEIFRERYLPHLQPFAGVRELFLLVKDRGHELAIASSAKTEELGALLEIAGVADLVERRTSSSDAENSKPDPDIVAAALVQLGRPKRAIMVGDTPYDIESAGRAGIASVAVRCGGWSDADLRDAYAVYADPEELRQLYDSSPLKDLARR
jgi:HAD superfamily hydrolase (TIGR01509 family)